jgi:integration host factor subunit alpha
MISKSENKTVTKADIVDRVYTELNQEEQLMTRKQSAELVDQVFETIKDEIKRLRDDLDRNKPKKILKGEKKPEKRLKISGFGNFIIRYKKSRPGRNPQNGQKIDITSRYVLTFKPSQVLKKAINQANSKR